MIYEPERLGLDLPARREAMRPYSEAFSVPDEPW